MRRKIKVTQEYIYKIIPDSKPDINYGFAKMNKYIYKIIPVSKPEINYGFAKMNKYAIDQTFDKLFSHS